MARATEQELRDFIGDTGALPSDRLNLVLGTSHRTVVRDGIAEDDENFADLQILFAAHLLETGGAIGGKLASRSISDISISFAPGTGNGSYCDLYRAMLIQITGLSGRIA